MAQSVLLRFLHLGIGLAFILEDGIPTYVCTISVIDRDSIVKIILLC